MPNETTEIVLACEQKISLRTLSTASRFMVKTSSNPKLRRRTAAYGGGYTGVLSVAAALATELYDKPESW